MIERDRRGNKTQDSKAALALAGMPPDPLSSAAWAGEVEYREWLGLEVNDDNLIVGKRWFTWWRRFQLFWAKKPITIFRAQIEALALGAGKMITDRRAATSQTSFYEEYVRMVAENRELRSFLGEHYGNDLREAEARNLTITAVIKDILLRQRMGA